VNAYRQHQDTQKQLEEARIYLKEEAASDPDMAGGLVCFTVARSTWKPDKFTPTVAVASSNRMQRQTLDTAGEVNSTLQQQQ
jgi:hypothetical protein